MTLKNISINIQAKSRSNLVSVPFPELKVSECVGRNSCSHMTNAVAHSFSVVIPTANQGH